MKRSCLLWSFLFFVIPVLAQTSSAPPKSQAPRCVLEACTAVLKGYQGPLLKHCSASYVQLSDKTTEAWLVSIDAGSSKAYRVVNAKTGEVVTDVDPKTVTRCGPRPFNCPDWVYKACPASGSKQ